MSTKPVKLNLVFTPEALETIRNLQKRIDEYQYRQNGTIPKKKNRRKKNKRKDDGA